MYFLRTYLYESISSGMQQQQPGTVTHSHISSLLSPDVCLGLELLRDIQFGHPALLNNSLASYDKTLSKFLNLPLCSTAHARYREGPVLLILLQMNHVWRTYMTFTQHITQPVRIFTSWRMQCIVGRA